jgi:hypothetical protein
MSKFEKNTFPLFVYKVAQVPELKGIDTAEWIENCLSAQALPEGKIGTGWSNQYPGHSDFSDEVMVYDVAAFQYVSAEIALPKSAVDAACVRAEYKYKKENMIDRISRKRKKEIREEIEEAMSVDAPITYNSIDFLYVPADGYLFLATSSESKADAAVSLFLESFEVDVVPVNLPSMYPGYPLSLTAYDTLNLTEGEGSDLDDMTALVSRDFLMWIWYTAEEGETREVMVDEDLYKLSFGFEGPLSFIDEAGIGAQKVQVDKGLPTLAPEAQEAILKGKKIHKANMSFARGDEVFSFKLDATSSCYNALKLPDGEAMDRKERVSEAVEQMIELDKIMHALMKEYASLISMEGYHEKMNDWAINRHTTS